MANRRKELGGMSGNYIMELLIGDATIANPLNWKIADAVVTFPEPASPSGAEHTYQAS